MDDQPAGVLSREEAETEFNRIVAFSDGVFSIAITLLVLTLEIPAKGDVGELLRQNGDQFFAYFLSFAVLARLWLEHHRFYGFVQRFDGRLLALNLAYLAFVALVPFTTELLGNYSDEPIAVALYAACLALTSLTFVAQAIHVNRAGLLREDTPESQRRESGGGGWGAAIVFAVSIPIAFVSTAAAMLSWIAIFFVSRAITQRIGGRSAKAQ